VVKGRLEIEIRNPSLTTATALDLNGQAVGRLPLHRSGDGVKLQWPGSSMYVVVSAG